MQIDRGSICSIFNLNWSRDHLSSFCNTGINFKAIISLVERSEEGQNFVVRLYGSAMEWTMMVLFLDIWFFLAEWLQSFKWIFTSAIGCCYRKENNSQECLCTGTEIDDPDTPGSCCMDDVDNPGNCCKFVYVLSFFKILINIHNAFLVEWDDSEGQKCKSPLANFHMVSSWVFI